MQCYPQTESPGSPNRLQFSSRPPEDVVACRLPGLDLPRAPNSSGLSQLPPTSHLCQVPQGLLQPLSLFCLQGRLLLQPQGFLEGCWGNKERVVRVSALV